MRTPDPATIEVLTEQARFGSYIEKLRQTIHTSIELRGTPSAPYAADLALQMTRQLIDMLLEVSPEEVS